MNLTDEDMVIFLTRPKEEQQDILNRLILNCESEEQREGLERLEMELIYGEEWEGE